MKREKVPSHTAAGGPVLQSGSHRKSNKKYNIRSIACSLHTLQQILSADHVCQNDQNIVYSVKSHLFPVTNFLTSTVPVNAGGQPHLQSLLLNNRNLAIKPPSNVMLPS